MQLIISTHSLLGTDSTLVSVTHNICLPLPMEWKSCNSKLSTLPIRRIVLEIKHTLLLGTYFLPTEILYRHMYVSDIHVIYMYALSFYTASISTGTPPPPKFHPLNPGDIARVQGSNEVALSLSWYVPDRYGYTDNITHYVITARPRAPRYLSTWDIDSRTTQHSVPVPVGAVVEFRVRAVTTCGEGRESSPVVVRTKGEGGVVIL